MDYSESQMKAVSSTDSNLQIIACAGSGKTQVISQRIVRLLQEGQDRGIGPRNIVAFTFTDKAAGELKDRIYRLYFEAFGNERGLAAMFVGTIHGYCLNMLQSPPVYRYLKYRVLNDVQQRLLIDRFSSRSGLASIPLLRGGNLQRWKDSRLYQQLLSILIEANVDLDQVSAQVLDATACYRNLLHEKGFLDYSTIVADAIDELSKNEDLRIQAQDVIKYVVVDEYQDINPLQERLIQELHNLGASVCVVGDDDQTVYQWRGSDVANILTFASRYPEVLPVPMEDNYRSSKGVVAVAEHIASKIPDRLPKKMRSAGSQEFQRGDILALPFADPCEEASWMARKIRSLHGTAYRDKPDAEPRGLSFSDFAILLRSVKNDAGPILQALDEQGVPYVVGGMNELFSTPEVQAIREVFYFLADRAPAANQDVHQHLANVLNRSGLGRTRKQIEDAIEFLEDRKSRIGQLMNAELYLQRVFLDFLRSIGLSEESIERNANRGGEIAYYNLGKFSQVISDFEQINFNSVSEELYKSFARFLEHQAPNYYPEGWLDSGYARPDAIQVMTVHQAKGMQWPAVFIPCLRDNRFPSRRQGGRSVWHIIPDTSVPNSDRYKGTVQDERRLFYVAITRAEKYLFCSWAPIASNQQQRKVSPFYRDFTDCEYVLTADPGLQPQRIEPKPRREAMTISLTFSELKYYFECPYLFKLRFLYGFDTPISRALGYGKSLHDALAEIHSESINGKIPTKQDVPRLVADHLHLPFANDQVRKNLILAANRALGRYLDDHVDNLRNLEHVEKVVELKLEEGVVVNGRIDLIRRADTGETIIVDFKSDERAQAEAITERQLHVYALGYEQLEGKRADLIEIHNLDAGGAKRQVVNDNLMESTFSEIVQAGRDLRDNNLGRAGCSTGKCADCDMSGICGG